MSEQRIHDIAVSVETSVHAGLREFYGRTLKTKADFAQQCCSTDETAARHKSILELIPGEVLERQYGCGCPIPEDDLTGLTVLDLGSGAGVDVFIASYKVGPSGFVHGIDMTPEQLDVARRNAPVVMKRFGYRKPNVAFHEGFIETADMIPDGSVDLVISDCVVNLSPSKDQVFATIHRVLKNGGELYMSDIASDRRVPVAIAQDKRLVAECLGGALYEHDLFDVMKEAGFRDPRVVRRSVMQTEVMGEPITFSSLTLRAFKFNETLDRRCEDYGQMATYLGNLSTSPARFLFDDHHGFEAERPTSVCRNTARMLSETRLSRHFRVTKAVKHFGLFPCGPTSQPLAGSGASAPCC